MTTRQDDGQWHAVPFRHAYAAPPVVVFGAPSFNGGQPTTIRVRNVSTGGFEFQMDEWEYLDGHHTGETMSFIAVLPGSHVLSDGSVVEAGRADVETRWTTVQLSSFDVTPVVLSQTSSVNDPEAVTTRVRGIDAQSFQVRIQEEEAGGSHAAETVGWIALAPSARVGTTGDVVKHDWHALSFGRSNSDPHFIAALQSTDGGNTSTLRYRNLTASGAEVFVEEEQSADDEVYHTTETVGWAVFDGPVELSTASEGGSEVASVSVSPSSASIEVDSTIALSATARDADGDPMPDGDVSWSSSSTDVATVDPSGLVTGVGEGSATITATVDGVSDSASVTVSAPPAGGGGSPDPTALPSIMTGTARPDWSAYAALDLGHKGSGFTYSDPATGARVTKLTDASTPYAGPSGFGSMYSDGGAYISHPWGPDGDRFTILVFQGDDQRSWLVDYQLGGTLSNWRELTGSMRPHADLAFTFSNDPSTPRIAYVANGSQIVRIDTRSMTLANTGNFPHTASAGVSYWLQMDKNDQWFVWHAGGSQVRAWNSATDAELTQSWSGLNEPRFERGGRYVMLSGQPAFRIWDLEANTLGSTQNHGPMAHNASLDGYFVATDWDYGGYNRMNPSAGGAFTKVADRMVFDGGETHLSGAWIQGSGTDQWFVTSNQGNGGWPDDGYVMAHFGVALVRADGSDARLVAHTHSNTSGGYWSLPFANVGPSGHLVVWTSRNSTNGSNSVGDYALYVAEVPRGR